MTSNTPASPVLLTSNLAIGYPTRTLARDLHLSLFWGEVTALLGANGAGKSTLLRTLSGGLSPIAGKVEICGTDLCTISPAHLARLISIVFTSRTGAGALTVRQLVALGRQPHTGFWGRLSASDYEIVDKAIADVGISALAYRHVATLSDGEHQKTMIARALAQQTPVIILDEPTSFLDVASRLEIMSLLSDISKSRNVAVLLSTHDVAAALTVASRLWLMDSNAAITCGTPDELIQSGAMNRLFASRSLHFDSAAMDYRLATD